MNSRNGFHGSGISMSFRDGDFEEDDVWDVLQERKEIGSKIDTSTHRGSPRLVSRYLPSAARMVPGARSSEGNSTTNEGKIVQQSAPVSIPDWSRIQATNSKMGIENVNSDGSGDSDDDMDDDNDDEHGSGIPPHEIIARRAARSQISSFSVFEGAGRTLKGRDLLKVRNAVLSKTGFLD